MKIITLLESVSNNQEIPLLIMLYVPRIYVCTYTCIYYIAQEFLKPITVVSWSKA
jgi:hypothetical protein